MSKRRIGISAIPESVANSCKADVNRTLPKIAKTSTTLDYLTFTSGQLQKGLVHVHSRKLGKVLASRISSPSYEYRRIAGIESRYCVSYDQNRVYIESCFQAYSIGCYDIKPLRFLSPPFQARMKDYLYVQGLPAKQCLQCQRLSCCQPSLMALSIKNIFNRLLVIQLNAFSGYVRHFDLDPLKPYSSRIDWNVADESFTVSFHDSEQKLFKFHIFSVLPIDYSGAVSVNQDAKGVGVIKKVLLNLDMLILHEGRDTVCLHSFVEKMRYVCPKKDLSIANADDLGPALLTVKGCCEFDLQIGGFPYCLLIAQSSGYYIIKSLDQQHVLGKIPPIDFESLEKDVILFDDMESGNIIQRGEHIVRVFKVPLNASSLELFPMYKPVDLRPVRLIEDTPAVSRYGRTVRKRVPTDNSISSPPLN